MRFFAKLSKLDGACLTIKITKIRILKIGSNGDLVLEDENRISVYLNGC